MGILHFIPAIFLFSMLIYLFVVLGVCALEKCNVVVKNLDSLKSATNKNPVTAMSWSDDSEQEILIGYGNQHVKVYNIQSQSFTSTNELKCGEGHIVGVLKYNGYADVYLNVNYYFGVQLNLIREGPCSLITVTEVYILLFLELAVEVIGYFLYMLCIFLISCFDKHISAYYNLVLVDLVVLTLKWLFNVDLFFSWNLSHKL